MYVYKYKFEIQPLSFLNSSIFNFLSNTQDCEMNYSETCGVTLCVLRFACRTIERTHSDYITGIAFEALHAVSMKFKHCLKGWLDILNVLFLGIFKRK